MRKLAKCGARRAQNASARRLPTKMNPLASMPRIVVALSVTLLASCRSSSKPQPTDENTTVVTSAPNAPPPETRGDPDAPPCWAPKPRTREEVMEEQARMAETTMLE